MPCGCGKQSPGDGIRMKKPPCTCQSLAANIATCCKGGKQPPTPKETSCYCKPTPPRQVDIAKTCRCDEVKDDLDFMPEEEVQKEPEKAPPSEEKKKKKKKKSGKSNAVKFQIKLSPEQLASICMCGDECDCKVCTCKPETLWECTDPSETDDCCIQLEGENKCGKAGKSPPMKYILNLTPEQLAQTCDCDTTCSCEMCTCKIRLKSCKIVCLKRFKGKKTCPCVCFKSLDGEGGEGGEGAEEAAVEEEEEEEDEDDDFLGDIKTSATPDVSCKCKFIRQAVEKIQEKRKPCGPSPPPKCCPR